MPRTEIYPFIQIDHEVYRPMVKVIITNPVNNMSQGFWALLDTGADKCLFPKGVCELLGLDINSGKHGEAGGIEGKIMTVWEHSFLIDLPFANKAGFFWKSKNLQVGCVDHDNAPILLGWNGCMEFFNIRFNYPTKRIIIDI